MNVSQLMQLIDTHKHLGRIEFGMFFLEHARVIQQRSEVASWDIFLKKENNSQ